MTGFSLGFILRFVMKQKRKSEAEKLITKPVTMRPALVVRVEELAQQEDRTFSAMARILIERGLAVDSQLKAA